MIWILLGFAVIAVLAFLAFLKAKRNDESENDDFLYSKQKVLFSPAERSFLGVLTKAVGDEALIFGKVRVADVITPKKGMSRSAWQKAFNRISGKHFDFLLCAREDLSIKCAVELNDATHHSKNRKKRDVFLEGACKSSSLPLIQVPAKSSYNIGEIRDLFNSHFDNDFYGDTNKLPELEGKQTAEDKSYKVCPKCSSMLVKRVAKKGKNAGSEFWACSSFPKCRYTEAINV